MSLLCVVFGGSVFHGAGPPLVWGCDHIIQSYHVPTMKITNKHNAPDSLVAFANAKHYDAGGSTYTVTQLIDSPRVRILRSRHYRDMEEDVYATVFRLVGTSLHHIAEQYGGEGAEERLFLDLTEELGRGERLVVSGAIDLQSDDDGAVVIGDYKMTSVAATRFPDKWAKQLNMYAYLVQRVNGKRVSKLEVYAILKDWNWRTASTRSDYPKQPGVTIPIDLWSYEEQEDFFMGRIKAHIEADTMEEPALRMSSGEAKTSGQSCPGRGTSGPRIPRVVPCLFMATSWRQWRRSSPTPRTISTLNPVRERQQGVLPSVMLQDGVRNTKRRTKAMSSTKQAVVMSFSIKKSEQKLARSIRKFAKDNGMNVSESIKSILLKRLSRGGYEV